MSKISTDLRLATTPTEHHAITREVEQLCDQITHHGESSCANALFALIELLTDTRTNASDREGLAGDAMRRVFGYTDAGNKAFDAAILEINPEIAKWKVRAA